MYSDEDTLAGGLPHSDIHGSTPARGSPWLFAACHVLHRLLVPRHPPNALLILDTIDAAPKGNAHHAQKPSSEKKEDDFENLTPHNTIFPHGHFFEVLAHFGEKDPSDNIVHRASEPSPSTVGAPFFQPEWFTFAQNNNNSRSDKSAERRDLDQPETV
jgi:hypothetical protein